MTSTVNNFLSTWEVSATSLSTHRESCHWVLSKWVLWLSPLRERPLAQVHATRERQEWWVGPAALGWFDERYRCCFFHQVRDAPATLAPGMPPAPRLWGQESLRDKKAPSSLLRCHPEVWPAAGSFHSSRTEPGTSAALHLHGCQQAEMCSNLGTLSKAGIIPLK